ncbi:hypothetical protein [Phenylobacterium sp. J367]|uniref:hypothetical protein n=1 Tax=Phenylobacterium sp. J367 TaxID=2898435 RepID=UPI002151EC42|nr:hypothetical protein [Phenylobacterium sp. J367]MCR5877291.1 hypothetical protein [Phenylobacterium sp. J367]
MRLALGAIWPTLVGAFWGNVLACLPFLIVRDHFGLPAFLAEWVIPLAGIVVGGLLGFLRWRGRYGGQGPVTTHGSAQFGDERRARGALGGADGLIIGRAAGAG